MSLPFYSFIVMGVGIIAAAFFTYKQRSLQYGSTSHDRQYTPSNSWNSPGSSNRPKYDRQSKCVICVMDLKEPVYTFNCSKRHTVHMECKEQIDANNVKGCPICG